MIRRDFTMTQGDYDRIIKRIDAASGPLIMLQCGPRPTVQQAANEAWIELGARMGFDGMSVRPGASKLQFTAIERMPE